MAMNSESLLIHWKFMGKERGCTPAHVIGSRASVFPRDTTLLWAHLPVIGTIHYSANILQPLAVYASGTDLCTSKDTAMSVHSLSMPTGSRLYPPANIRMLAKHFLAITGPVNLYHGRYCLLPEFSCTATVSDWRELQVLWTQQRFCGDTLQQHSWKPRSLSTASIYAQVRTAGCPVSELASSPGSSVLVLF